MNRTDKDMDNKWDMLESSNEDREKIWAKNRTFAGDVWFRFRHKPTAIAGLIIIVVLILFALLIIRGYWLAIHARDRFGALLIVGVTTQVAVQVFLNIGVVTNLFPVTGISLPFFSYGGTALLIQLLEMGIVLSVSRQIPAPKAG